MEQCMDTCFHISWDVFMGFVATKSNIEYPILSVSFRHEKHCVAESVCLSPFVYRRQIPLRVYFRVFWQTSPRAGLSLAAVR